MLTKNQIDARIATIGNNTKKIREQIQIVLVNCSGHAYEHGDVTSLEKLFNATSGVNRKRMTAWIHDHGFARIQKDGSFKLNKSARKDAEFDTGEQLVEYLTENAPEWWVDEESASQVKAELDVAARVKSLANQVVQSQQNGKTVKVDPKQIREAMAQLETAITSTADSVETADIEPTF